MDFDGLWYECDDLDTNTSIEQCECEEECARYLKPLSSLNQKALKQLREVEFINSSNEWLLLRDKHINYLLKSFEGLSHHFITLDASKPWILYWVTHGLYLLGHDLDDHDTMRLYTTLKYIQNCKHNHLNDSHTTNSNGTGGFGGGPSQISHAAPNYAAVLAICTVAYSCNNSNSNSNKSKSSSNENNCLSATMIYDLIDRKSMYRWFLSLKDEATGGFRMHKDGEIDSRASYTVLAVSRILNILTDELTKGVKKYLLSCQTYEGGFGGEPFNEAHGGYNFCAVAGLYILNSLDECDIEAQERWLLYRQMKLEGGFQGRTNKLVDSCYSFWQGAACAMITRWKEDLNDVISSHHNRTDFSDHNNCNNDINHNHYNHKNHGEEEDKQLDMNIDDSMFGASIATPTATNGHMSFNQLLLQRYILLCSQQTTGGLRDKPGKNRDYYHTCYSLSGLAVAQRAPPTKRKNPLNNENENEFENDDNNVDNADADALVYGDASNLVNDTNPIYNISEAALAAAVDYYKHEGSSSSTHMELLSFE